jgi:surfeit locus 1 family protein
VVLLVLLLSLGFWQLDRAAQKRSLLDAYGARPIDSAVQLSAAFAPDINWRYRRAEIEGSYLPTQQFLLDNRVYQGRVGYQVLTPLRLKDGVHAVLVNRGWVPQGKTRADLPKLPVDQSGVVRVEGLIDLPATDVFVLGEGEDRDPGWPKVLQRVRLDLQAQQLGAKLLPVVLLLGADQPDGFVRDWKPVVFGPERHVGYAVQWFSLSTALLVIYIWVNLKRTPVIPKSDDTADSE